MQTGSACEQVDGQTQHEAEHQQLPFRGVEGQQHDEDQENVGMDITAKADMVDDQYLEKHEHDETDDLEYGLVHVIGIWLLVSRARVCANL